MTTINVYQTWQQLLQVVNVQQNGQIPPTVFLGWYNETSLWLFKRLAEEYQLSQIMSDLLSPYAKYVNVMTTTASGQNFSIAPYPADYEYFLSAAILRQAEEDTCFCNKDYPLINGNGQSVPYTDPDIAQMKVNFAGANVEERQINLIDTQRWASCLNHYTKKPIWDNPKMTQFQGGFKVAPKGITSLLLYYLQTPTQAIFNYTVSSQDILIYQPVGSTQLQWSVQVLNIFLGNLVIKYGLYIDDPTIVKMGDDMLAMALNSK